MHPRANHQHGTYLAYQKDRCRCGPCTVAYSRKRKQIAWRAHTGTHTYVGASRARAHVEGLLTVLTISQVEARSGVNRRCIRLLVGAIEGEPATKRITRKTEAGLLAVRAERVGDETHGLVDPTGTQRRMRALYALGWTQRRMVQMAGMSSRTVNELLIRDDYPDLNVVTRAKVRDLYDRLSLATPPQYGQATYARRLAAERGWAPPLAWDDDTIDDPAAEPAPWLDEDSDECDFDEAAVQRAVDGDRTVKLTETDLLEVIRRLHARGLMDVQIGTLLGLRAHRVNYLRGRVIGLPINKNPDVLEWDGFGDLTPAWVRSPHRGKAS